MIEIRKAAERGHGDHGWLESWHTFSFSDYYDPRFMGFRSLRVMNEDFVAPGQGFGMHPHRDMEIVTCVLSGALEHKDSMGNGEVLHPGEFQRMSAGTGILHSEFNPSSSEPTHLYQIWLLPERKGIEPSYEQKRFDESARRNRWQLVASRDGEAGSLRIHQDARIYLARLDAEANLHYELSPTRHAWVQILWGEVSLDGNRLRPGDGAALGAESHFDISAIQAAEVMLFDLN